MSFACHSYQCVLGILIPTASCTFKQSKCSELLMICHHFFLALVTKHKSTHTHTTIQQTFSAYLHKWSGDFYPLRTEAFQTEDSGNGLCHWEIHDRQNGHWPSQQWIVTEQFHQEVGRIAAVFPLPFVACCIFRI